MNRASKFITQFSQALKPCSKPLVISRSVTSVLTPEEQKYHPYLGNREIVGFGRNGNPQYADDCHFPYPSIRFGENTAENEILRAKEKQNWQNLTIDEKKALYRHSFCMTLAEHNAPNPRWKLALAWALFVMSGSMLYFAFLKSIVLNLPKTKYAEKDYKNANMYRRLYSRDGPIDDVISAFDFENMKWK